MKIIVGAAALNQTPLDWHGNAENIRTAIRDARAAGVEVLGLPELCITGYGCEDAFLSSDTLRTVLEVLQELAPDTTGMIVTAGLPLETARGRLMTAVVLVDGEIVGFTGKHHLARHGLHYEPRWFTSCPLEWRDTIEIGGRSYPVGDLHYDIGGVRFGFEICEDAWLEPRRCDRLGEHGVDLIINPSASHFAFGKYDRRRALVAEGVRRGGAAYMYINLSGNEAGRIIYDAGSILRQGDIETTGPRLRYAPVTLTTLTMELGDASRDDARPELCVSHAFACRGGSAPTSGTAPTWEASGFLKEEAYERTIALGLYDYLRKSRSRGFVVSLSGGADSTAVACHVALMIRHGVADLGLDAFRRSLSFIPGLDACADERAMTELLLTCVYQATRNSSTTTREAARAVAQGIGARFIELDVAPMVQHYVDAIEQAIQRPLTWERDDVTLQNIQARVRGPGAWMLANINGALLLATSNRSEAAVGYATMDGDTCGGLCPIAGIDKAFLRRWLCWLETDGPEEIGPIPSVRAVNVLEPTAELRPASAGQTDEDDLMPYDILDEIERAAIRDKCSPTEVFDRTREQFPERAVDDVHQWVTRFFHLWCQNQWKRERYAPSFHVDDENLDPKTWCRFPILSGGYRRELAELDAHVKRLRERAS